MRIDGVGKFVLTHPDGSKDVYEKHNLILNAGFDFICDAIGAADRPATMSYIAVGTGTAATAAGQTSLVSELSRKSASYTHASGTKVLTISADFPEGVATGAITEAGVVNASSGGTFLDRVVFDVINKGNDDKFTATFQFTIS